MIFQEPMSSFSPVHTIGNQVEEVIHLHMDLDKKQTRERAIKMLGKVCIVNPKRAVNQYPFEFSGGMRQRAIIALSSCFQRWAAATNLDCPRAGDAPGVHHLR